MRPRVETFAVVLALLFAFAAASSATAQPTADGAYQFQLSSEAEGINLPLGIGAAYSRPLFGRLSIGGLFDWSRGSISDTPIPPGGRSLRTITAVRTQMAFGGLLRYQLHTSSSRTIELQAAGGGVRSSERLDTVFEGDPTSLLPVAEDTFTRPFVSGGFGVTFRQRARWNIFASGDYRVILMDGENIANLRVSAGIRKRL